VPSPWSDAKTRGIKNVRMMILKFTLFLRARSFPFAGVVGAK